MKPTLPRGDVGSGPTFGRGATIAIVSVVALVAIFLALAVYAGLFGGPLKSFFCALLTDGRISKNGRYCIP